MNMPSWIPKMFLLQGLAVAGAASSQDASAGECYSVDETEGPPCVCYCWPDASGTYCRSVVSGCGTLCSSGPCQY
jgi:hypothetical protein